MKISASGGLPALENRGIIASGNTDASDGGGAGAACGGGGRVYVEATTSLVNNGSSTNGNLLAAGGTGTGRPGTDGTVKIIRPQVTNLVFASGSMIIDTSMATITHSDGSFLAGSFEEKPMSTRMESLIPTRFVYLLPTRLAWAPEYWLHCRVPTPCHFEPETTETSPYLLN